MTSKRESKSDHQKKFNLGQREAAQEKQKDTELPAHGGIIKEARAGADWQEALSPLHRGAKTVNRTSRPAT
jgi:hypothetical protein